MKNQLKTIAIAAAVFAAAVASSYAQVKVAGNLLIDLHASRGVVTNQQGRILEWKNFGTKGGSFVPFGLPDTLPGISNLAGQVSIGFDGGDYLKGTIPAPDEITGSAAPANDYTIEVWVNNPAIATEECVFSWARRGGGNGTGAQINYGSSTGAGGFGAVSHWGAAADMGWNTVPAAGQWHLITVVYDGSTEYLYLDGVLQYSEAKTLNIRVGEPMTIGTAYEASFIPSKQYSGYVASLRVHSGVLSAADVAANYAAGINAQQAVYALQPTDIGTETATINGYLALDGANVTVFYGTVNGGTDAGAWQMSIDLGQLNAGFFSAQLIDLWDLQPYFFKIRAVKDNVTYWSDQTGTFSTVTSPPAIGNIGAKTVTTVYARLYGNLTATNWGVTQVKLCIGKTDGGAELSQWEQIYDLGVRSVGVIEAKVSNLQPGTLYYYRFYAENAAGGAFAPASATFTTAPYFDRSGYEYFSTITFNGYTQTETLTNFPALVVLGPAIQGFSYADFKSGNADLKFVDANGTELKHEIELWDTSGNSYIWVQIPELTNNMVISMFWGKAGVSEPGYRTDRSVWSDGFAGVWHMNTKYSQNAAQNAFHIDTVSNPANMNDTVGKIGIAQALTPNVYATAGDLDMGTNITMSAWVWANTLNAEHHFIGKGDSYLLWSTTGGTGRWEINPWGGDVAATLPGVNQWFHIVGVWDGAVQTIYVNGVKMTQWNKFSYIVNSSYPFCFGAFLGSWTGRYHDGKLDECRVENVSRSAAWIWASYKNQDAPYQFATYSAASWLGAPIALGNLSVSRINSASATFAATLFSDGAVGVTSWGFAWGTSPAPTENEVAFSGYTNAPFSFAADINSLQPGTHYYFRAWARNDAEGKVYSADGEFYTEPDAASDVVINNIQNNQMTITWTKPVSATGSIVLVREGGVVTAKPVDGANYNPNAAFQQGDDLGGGCYAVYIGSGNQVTVSDLVPGKTYYVAVYTYAGQGTLINYYTASAAIASAQAANVLGKPIVGGRLLIDINAAQGVVTDENGLVKEWVNYGAIGGSFVEDTSVPSDPIKGTTGGQRAVIFNGANHLKATFTAPREITGKDSLGNPDDYAIEIWVYNPSIANEEWIFSWGKRGTDNRCASVGYGAHGTWGAIGHWGPGDVAFSGGVPTAGTWHHIVYVYDGVANYIYVDGVLNTVKPNNLNIWDDGPVVLGDQYWDGPFSYANIPFSGSLAALRVHSRILTAEQVANNFALGPGVLSGPVSIVAQPLSKVIPEFDNATFSVSVDGEPPIYYQWFKNGQPIPSATNRVFTFTNATEVDNGAIFYVVCSNIVNGQVFTAQSDQVTLTVLTIGEMLTHRYSFDGNMRDSVGTAHGTLRKGAYIQNGMLVLAGSGQYGELPGGLITGYTNVTIEFWASFGNNGNWSRVFDFGDRNSANLGRTYIFFSPHSGNADHRASIAAGSGDNAGYTREEFLVGGGILDNLGMQHIVCVYDPPKGIMKIYRNGILEAQRGISIQLTEINNVYSWLGRSLYQPDAFMNGSIEEFRIYNGVLSDAQIAMNYTNGPNAAIGYGPVAFVEQPQSRTVSEGNSVVLFARAYGRPPISYQWFKNGLPIEGATNMIYVTEKLYVADNGIQFFCKAYNEVNGQTVEAQSDIAVIEVVGTDLALLHRYTFDFDASDSVGIADGTLRGGAVVQDGKAYFNGMDAYIELLPHMIDYLDAVTIEFWAEITNSAAWTRVFDFGDINAANQGRTYLFFAPNTHWNGTRLAITDSDPGGNGEVVIDTPGATSLNNKGMMHVVCVVDPPNHFMAVYTNGVLAASRTDLDMPLSKVVNNYSFIGKSLYGVDPYLNGAIDEFRIYRGALTPEAVYQNYLQGPSVLPQGGAPAIVVQPQSQTIELSSNAVLSVVAVGTAPIAYQWYDGMDPIPNATNATLNLGVSTMAMSGHDYSVTISNLYGQVTSEPAVITVVDTQPPTVISYPVTVQLSVGEQCTAVLPDLTTNVVANDPSGEITIAQSIQPGTTLQKGEYEVVLTITDSSNNSVTRTSIVTVADTTAPAIVSYQASYIQNVPQGGMGVVPNLVGSVTAIDNCDGASVTITQDMQAGTEVGPGTYPIQVSVSDSSGNTTNLTITFIVNTIPVASSQQVNMMEDESVSIILSGNDFESQLLLYSINSLPAKGILKGYVSNLTNLVQLTSENIGLPLLSNIVVYIPNTNYYGEDSFTFSVSDGLATSAVANVQITIENVIDGIVVPPIAAETLEDSIFQTVLNAVSLDNLPVSYSLVSTTTPRGGQVSLVNNTLSYTPPSNFNGVDTIQYVVTDGLTTITQEVQVVVAPVNDVRPYPFNQAVNFAAGGSPIG
ncbi:MAG: DUF2341 domain-containing protein, partial [Verrucomicrobiia bacterium]